MVKILETDRLYLREFVEEDAIHLFEMNNDPQVIKYTGDAPFLNLQAAKEFITNYDAYQKTGIGRYAVIRKEDERFLGWSGLKYHPEERVIDVGYRFYQKYWGQGFATESAQAIINYAFNELKYPCLVAHAHKENTRSHKVINKCKMSLLKEFVYDGHPAIQYHIKNPDYTLKEIPAKDTWPVRHPVLRKGRPLKDVYMEADEQESTFHLGMYYKNNIVGVASFMQDSHTDFNGTQARLRGMAVLPEFRKKGLAELILKRGEEILKEKGNTLLWFNARIIAVNFYKNLGYITIGSEFDIPLVGPHYVMKKQLI